jgi:hypothetical protein
MEIPEIKRRTLNGDKGEEKENSHNKPHPSAFFAHLGPKPTLILPLASCSVSTSVNGYSVEKLPHYSHYGAHPISVHI